MTSFTPILNEELEQGNLMTALNSRKIKVEKTLVVMFVKDRNLARYLQKTYCVRKCKKMDIENLITLVLYGTSTKRRIFNLGHKV